MKELLPIAAVIALALAGCGGGDESSAETATVSAAAGAVPFDRSFIDAMAPRHRSAIEMAREAKQAGLSQPELGQIADDIIATQQTEIDQMLNWREAWYGGSPEPERAALATLGLSAEEAGMMAHGGDLSTSDDVDQTFAEMMIGHHEGAIRMAELAGTRAGHDEIRTLAKAIIAAQAREIEIMQPHAAGEHH